MSDQLGPSVAGLFVGCGGLDLGFKNAGYDLVWANELSADAAQSYKDLIGHPVVVGDIWEYLDAIPQVDILIGGPPCQAFSLVGKRLEDDPRAKLVFAFEQAVEKIMPQVFVMENVPGLMVSSVDGIKLHEHLAAKFRALGYKVEILKLIATDFFVPQKRKRVLMIGHRFQNKEFKLIDSKDFATLLGQPDLLSPICVSEALDDLPSPLPKGAKQSAEYVTPALSAYAKLMRKNNGKAVFHQVMPTMSLLDKAFVKHIPPGGNYMDIPDELSTKRIMSFKATGGRTTTYGRLHPDFPAYTINTYFNRPNVGANYHYRDERLITVREALRLQSFPDHFSPYYSNQRSLHMQVGNAVPPLMAQAIAYSIKQLFEWG
ncbi:DNA cytosine methyltransferase [Acinetobacter ursingii]|uniref:DNA cytosine methyltransferase n=1 Tax=Acinetobacter ursingii TaxID=108980 RepID=UPI00148F3EF7|nr:DNA cytosine methyltransferase [Acinetobacter ursingii]MCU4588706.1 DNA cytosine methyltransferase [Acinetobacter ursingii]